MFNNSKEIIKNINSCRCEINTPIVITNGKVFKEITKAVCIVDLLSVSELKRYTNLGHKSDVLEAVVENVIVKDKVKEILNFEGYSIDIQRSPAGSITTLAFAIYLKSKMHLMEPEPMYRLQEQSITMIDKMAAIIAYYMNIPFTTVLDLPVNEIYRRYAITSGAFPSQVLDPFYVPPEEEL